MTSCACRWVGVVRGGQAGRDTAGSGDEGLASNKRALTAGVLQ